MTLGKSPIGLGRAIAGRFVCKGMAAVVLAAVLAGCAHSGSQSEATTSSAGAVPRDAWGNPILVSQNTK
jgi:hypothetical protein